MTDVPRQKIIDMRANLEKQREHLLGNRNGVAGAIQVLGELLAEPATEQPTPEEQT